MKKKGSQVTTVCGHFYVFVKKKLLTISLALNGKKPGVLNFYKLCHITKHVTSKGPKSALSLALK